MQRYPEVLEYFYSLVELTLPDDNEPAVKDPPLSALSGGSRKAGRRLAPGTTIVSGPSLAHEPLPRRTPPPPLEPRRTPAPRGGRRYAPPAPGPTTYYAPPYGS